MNEYDRLVNRKWQSLPHETIFAVDKKMAEKFVKKSWRKIMKGKFPYKIEFTSGNRHTWVYRNVCRINPDKGWKEIVHLWSHYLGRRKRFKPHGNEHLCVERDCTDLAIAEFVGKQTPEKPKPSVTETRAANVDKRLLAWQRKLKRAQTAIQKLKRQQKYYQSRSVILDSLSAK